MQTKELTLIPKISTLQTIILAAQTAPRMTPPMMARILMMTAAMTMVPTMILLTTILLMMTPTMTAKSKLY